MTAIVDYKAGNLTSVKYALDALGEESVVTGDPAAIASAPRVIFPGVGAAKSAMENLRALGLEDAVKRAAAEKPFLGICLGMQILFESTEEDGGVDCLGVLPGRVRRFPDVPGCKIPHMGWNSVEAAGAEPPPYYYFVHSYYAPLCEHTAGTTGFAGVRFSSMVRRGRLLACQFHPEKSGAAGLALMKGWLESC